jgi:OOP family OmpA-OmpF porin
MKRALLGLLTLVAPAAAPAGDEAGHWYINPYFGGISPDKTWAGSSNSQLLSGIDVGNNLSALWTVELDFNYASLSNHLGSGGGHVNLWGGALDALRVWNRHSRFAPYVVVGAGATGDRPPEGPDLSSRTGFMAQAGVGAFIKLWENSDASQSFSLRPDLKARWTDTHGNPVDFLYVLGFTLTWGPGVTPVAVAALVAATAPPPPELPPPPPPPASPPADVILEGVTFATNSAVLTEASKPILDDVAQGLRQHPQLVVEVQGHTDSTGSPAYNLQLSQRRAESVRDYLISQGVAPGQLTAKGYGQNQPIASNSTPAGRAQNRRVVMHVLQNPGDVVVHKEGQA